MKRPITSKIWGLALGLGLILLLLLGLGWPGPSQGVWQQAGEAPFPGGFGEAVVATNTGIYLVREFRANTPPEFWRFRPEAAHPWTELTTEGLPEGPFRPGTALAWDRVPAGYLYALLGGRSPKEGDADRRLFYRFSLRQQRWEALPATPGAQGAGNALVYAEHEGRPRLYAFLGSREHWSEPQVQSGTHTVFAYYDLEEARWTVLPFNPDWMDEGTDAGAALAWDGFDQIYALRGKAYGLYPPNAQFARYDMRLNRWQALSSLPEADPSHGFCGVAEGASLIHLGGELAGQSDYVYALGGGCADGRPGGRFYRYVISEDRWEALTALPCPVGAYVGNRLAFYGGSLYYWQGSAPDPAFLCGGEDLFAFDGL